MATYNGNSDTISKLVNGDIINYAYSGAVKNISLPKGQYKLECWGAQGGTGYTRVGTANTSTSYTGITTNNYSNYFTISNGSYYFNPDSYGDWSANNLGQDSTTATTTWTCTSSGTYRLTWDYVTEQRYDKLTIKANGTVYADAVSGSSSGSTTVNLSNGATIEATYAKDSSRSETREKAVLKIEKENTTTSWSYGSSTSYSGGKGGYSIGILTLKNPSTAYIRTGGEGSSNNTTSSNVTVSGGFNGGGNSKSGYYNDGFTTGGGGGGASDVRIDTDDLYSRVIVAGGGGGAAGANDSSKYGGGVSGGSPVSGFAASESAAGTTGSFGIGGSHTGSYNYKYRPRGGGGGWYGGGCVASSSDSNADTVRGSNGGGSGYVYTASTASNYPSGCKLNSTHYLTSAETYAGNTPFISTTDGINETGHSGNGYVRITVIKIDSINIPCKVDGVWKTGDTVKAKIDGLWKDAEATYVKIDGVWKQQ